MNEFLELLKQTPRSWKLVNGQLTLGSACPICAVANKKIGRRMFSLMAFTANEEAELRLKDWEVLAIMSAADCSPEGYDAELRIKLLEACGINE